MLIGASRGPEGMRYHPLEGHHVHRLNGDAAIHGHRVNGGASNETEIANSGHVHQYTFK